MTNQEMFKNYGSERWAIEQNLCFLLQGYWEECNKHGYVNESQMPINPVGFVKKFMKEETLCSVEFAEKSKLDSMKKDAVDAEYVEVFTGA